MATPEHNGYKILVVDDEPFVRDSVKMILNSVGYQVEMAGSVTDALFLLQKSDFDLVLLDYSMPKVRGDELAAIVKERLPTKPVIMMTAYAEMLECKLTPLVGVDRVLSKPFRAGILCEAVGSFLPPKKKKDAEPPKA